MAAKLKLVEEAKSTVKPSLDDRAVELLRDVAVHAPEPLMSHVPPELMEWLYKHLRGMAEEICKPRGFPLPEIVISVDVNDRRQLGHFKIGRDGLGLKWRVSMNLVHLARPQASVLSTLLHEMLHAWQHQAGRPPKRAQTHNVEFRKACDALGIPTDARGRDHGINPEGELAKYLARHKIDGAVELLDERDKVKPKGSTLAKMVCECLGEELVPLRVAWGKVDDLDVVCQKCNEPYRLAE